MTDSVSFQVVQGDFVAALADTLLAAGNNPALPMLCAVFAEGSEGDQFVTFTATDRFILLQRRIPAVEPLTGSFAALIPTDQVKMLVGVHKLTAAARRTPPAPLDMTVSETYLTTGQASAPLNTTDPFVKYAAVWPKRADAEVAVLPVDLAILGKIAKMSVYHKGQGVRLRFAGNGRGANEAAPRVIVVEFGLDNPDDARCVFMPMRMPE